jgi:hypothetical protein
VAVKCEDDTDGLLWVSVTSSITGYRDRQREKRIEIEESEMKLREERETCDRRSREISYPSHNLSSVPSVTDTGNGTTRRRKAMLTTHGDRVRVAIVRTPSLAYIPQPALHFS